MHERRVVFVCWYAIFGVVNETVRGVIQCQGRYFTGTQNTNHVPNIMQILQLPIKAYVTEMSEIPYLFFGIYLPPNPNTGTGLTGF